MSDRYIDTIEKDGESYGIHAEDSQIKGLIKADKDILSQIEVWLEDGKCFLQFPRYIVPLLLYVEGLVNGKDLFFDYNNEYVVDDTNNVVGDILSLNENIFSLSFDNTTYTEEDITNIKEGLINNELNGLVYIIKNNYGGTLNSYYLYHPITSAGTKLYRHYIQDTVMGYNFILISDSSTVLTFSSFSSLYDQLTDMNVLSFYEEICPNRQMFYDSGSGLFTCVDISSGVISVTAYDDWSLSDTTDTVTEL